MTTQILRTIDRWRFETPLALALAASAGFAVLTMPAGLFQQLPVAGGFGAAGRALAALLLAGVSGGVAYWVMRKPVKTVATPMPVDTVEPIPEEELPSGMPAERLARFRRADAHPDAPPREPIIASRDLGEPFMDVGSVPPPAEARAGDDDSWWPDSTIPDGEFVEVGDEPATSQPSSEEASKAPAVDAEIVPEPAPAMEAKSAVPAPRADIAAMMDRLSAGLERRAREAPPASARDRSPALREALDELNRLAERRE